MEIFKLLILCSDYFVVVYCLSYYLFKIIFLLTQPHSLIVI